jgi:hypothetical protein
MVSNASLFRLALAKLLYMNARNTGTLVRRVVSIHNMDMAIETTLKTVATELGVSVRTYREGKFPELWKLVNRLYTAKFHKSLPLTSEIHGIHDARNAVQHRGSIPSETDLKQHLEYAQQFLDEVFITVAGLGLDQVFLSSIIENRDVRQMMEIAERNISSDHKASMNASMRSFMYAKILAQRQLGHFDPTFGAFDPTNKLQRAMKDPIDEVAKRLMDRFSIVELGIDAVRYSKITRIAPCPLIGGEVTRPDDIVIADTLQSNYTESNAWTCYDFAFETILSWQEMGL